MRAIIEPSNGAWEAKDERGAFVGMAFGPDKLVKLCELRGLEPTICNTLTDKLEWKKGVA